jgi:hypothetical protein
MENIKKTLNEFINSENNNFIIEGVTFYDDKFIFSFDKDGDKDIIHLNQYFDNKDYINDNVYYFGYKFNDNIDGRIKSEFLKQLKYRDLSSIKNDDYNQFIKKSVNNLNKKVNLAKVDLIIYPETKSPLVMDILKYIYDFTSPTIKSIELVKNSIDNIEFDYDNFDLFMRSKNISSSDRKVLRRNIDNMMNVIKSNTYFSIAKNVKKPKYREYFKNFLKFKDDKDKSIIKSIQSDSNILIIDDINTSETRIKELLRNINYINNDNDKVIFTLLGK